VCSFDLSEAGLASDWSADIPVRSVPGLNNEADENVRAPKHRRSAHGIERSDRVFRLPDPTRDVPRQRPTAHRRQTPARSGHFTFLDGLRSEVAKNTRDMGAPLSLQVLGKVDGTPGGFSRQSFVTLVHLGVSLGEDLGVISDLASEAVRP
jgi:hypothetical protein